MVVTFHSKGFNMKQMYITCFEREAHYTWKDFVKEVGEDYIQNNPNMADRFFDQRWEEEAVDVPCPYDSKLDYFDGIIGDGVYWAESYGSDRLAYRVTDKPISEHSVPVFGRKAPYGAANYYTFWKDNK